MHASERRPHFNLQGMYPFFRFKSVGTGSGSFRDGVLQVLDCDFKNLDLGTAIVPNTAYEPFVNAWSSSYAIVLHFLRVPPYLS